MLPICTRRTWASLTFADPTPRRSTIPTQAWLMGLGSRPVSTSPATPALRSPGARIDPDSPNGMKT